MTATEFMADIQKLVTQPAKVREMLEDWYEACPKEASRMVHFAVNGKHLNKEMMDEALETITRYDGVKAPFWAVEDFDELLKKSNIVLQGQMYNKYDVNFLAQYYLADFKSLGQDPVRFVCMALDRLHDIDDPKACEKAYRVAFKRIEEHHKK